MGSRHWYATTEEQEARDIQLAVLMSLEASAAAGLPVDGQRQVGGALGPDLQAVYDQTLKDVNAAGARMMEVHKQVEDLAFSALAPESDGVQPKVTDVKNKSVDDTPQAVPTGSA